MQRRVQGLLTVLLQPEALTGGIFWGGLGLTAAVQIPMFAACVWLSRFRSPLLIILSPFAVSMLVPAGIVLKMWGPGVGGGGAIAGAVGAVILASGLVLCDAYRRWRLTDLE